MYHLTGVRKLSSVVRLFTVRITISLILFSPTDSSDTWDDEAG